MGKERAREREIRGARERVKSSIGEIGSEATNEQLFYSLRSFHRYSTAAGRKGGREREKRKLSLSSDANGISQFVPLLSVFVPALSFHLLFSFSPRSLDSHSQYILFLFGSLSSPSLHFYSVRAPSLWPPQLIP